MRKKIDIARIKFWRKAEEIVVARRIQAVKTRVDHLEFGVPAPEGVNVKDKGFSNLILNDDVGETEDSCPPEVYVTMPDPEPLEAM